MFNGCDTETIHWSDTWAGSKCWQDCTVLMNKYLHMLRSQSPRFISCFLDSIQDKPHIMPSTPITMKMVITIPNVVVNTTVLDLLEADPTFFRFSHSWTSL